MVAKPERPSLAGLPLKKKITLGPTLSEPEQDAPAPAPRAVAEPKVDDKVPVMVRMTRANRKALRQIALGMDTSVQALIEEAMHDIIRRHRGVLNP